VVPRVAAAPPCRSIQNRKLAAVANNPVAT
jgi:hypothetical protein